MTIKGRRFTDLRRAIEDVDGVSNVQLDEDYHNPSGRAAYSPYDAVVTLEDVDGDEWLEGDFQQLLSSIDYDEIVSFEPKDNGTYKVFISLATAEEQGITG